MNINIMEAIYNGDLYPAEKVNLNSPEDKEKMREYDKLMNHLEEILEPEAYKEIDKAMDLYAELTDALNREFFRVGLSMGLELSREAGDILQTYARHPEDSEKIPFDRE